MIQSGFMDVVERVPRWVAITVGLMLLALVGWADYLAGYHMTFSLFYLLPIVLVASRTSRLGGIAVSVLAALVLLGVEGSTRPGEMTIPVLIWNAAVRWGFFVLTVLALVEIQKSLRLVRTANEELAEANQELDAFTRTAAHDLVAPLAPIEGWVSVLTRRESVKGDGEAQRGLERIAASARRATGLIRSLLDFARAGRAAVQRSHVSLSDLAREVGEDLVHREPSRQVELVVAPGLEVDADPDLMRVVLQNLLGNAWKYSAQNPGARVEVGRQEDGAPGGRPVFFVRDNGVGFDMLFVDQIFVPFKRLHSSQEYAGTGIGLSTVKRIIERHDGRVWAESRPEHGTTIFFTV